MTGTEIVETLKANYFAGDGFAVRTGTDASEFARILVLIARSEAPVRLFGLRLVDYPSSPATLRFWRPERWNDENFVFDFTSTGDPGSGTTQSNHGVPTMCIPYHVDYYKSAWHTDKPWIPAEADTLMADLVGNILRRA
jgi:hypothetical protein